MTLETYRYSGILIPVLLSYVFIPCNSFEPITGTTVGIGVAISSIAFGIYQYTHCGFYECCSDRWINHTISTSRLNLALRRLYGQHLAQRAITKHVVAHLNNKSPPKALVLSLHGSTGTGKNYIARIIAETVYRKGLQSSFVHVISCNQLFPDRNPTAVKLAHYKEKLLAMIESKLALCYRSMFILDEIDHLAPGLIDVLTPYFEHYMMKHELQNTRSIFFLLSNSGATVINDFTVRTFESGNERESIELKNIEHELSVHALNSENQGGLWHSQLITRALVTAYVPFLPLERSHVEQCIYDIMLTKGFNIRHYEKAKDEILNQLAYYPKDIGRFSVTGCKRVAEKIDYVMDEF